jgi:hypothetical protein
MTPGASSEASRISKRLPEICGMPIASKWPLVA